jgi:hypothetical protein
MPYSKPMVLTRNFKSRMSVKIALGTICLALSTVAHADVVTLTLDADWSKYNFYNYDGERESNIPIGPYRATVDGGGYTNTPVLVFCYDFNSPTNIGTAYPGSVVPVVPINPTDKTYPTYLATMEATYLVNRMELLGGLKADLATRGAISMAIWELMNPSSTLSTPIPPDPAADPYLAEAQKAVASHRWTPDNAAHYPTWVPEAEYIQRFGGIVLESNPDPVGMPEPSSLVPLGFGMLGLFVFGRFVGWQPGPGR